MLDSGIMINVPGMHFARKGKKHVIKQSQMKITPWNDDNTSDIVNFNQKAKDILSIQSESLEYAT